MMIRSCLLLIAVIAPTAVAAAADRYVSPSGNDSNAGTLSAPYRTVTRAVGVANAGDRIQLRAGTYREQVTVARSGTASAPITIMAYGSEKPVLKGSDQVTGWTRHSGSTWKRAVSTEPQQLFDDGAPLAQCGMPAVYPNGKESDGTNIFTSTIPAGLSNLRAGRFWYDRGSRTLYAWLADSSDPNRSLMEASARTRVLNLYASSHVRLKGLTVRHSNITTTLRQGAAVELGAYSVVDGCDIQWCDFAGVALGYQKPGNQVLDSVISNNGDSGMSGSWSSSFLIRGCTIERNNYRNFNFLWHAGGIKIVTDGWGTIDRCTVRANKGTGVWFDYADSGSQSVVSGCHIADNVGDAGLMVEASKAVTVKNNLIVNNGRRGVYIASSDNVQVVHNTVCGSTGQAAICVAGMPRTGKSLTNVSVYDNIVSGNGSTYDIFMVKENGGDIRGLACDNNVVWRPSGAIANWWGADGRGNWAGTTYTSITAWRNGTPYGDRCRQGNPQFGSGGWRPMAGSPAIDGGRSIAGVTIDYTGAARLQGAACDMGAYEFGSNGVIVPKPQPDPTPPPADDGDFAAKVNFQPSGAPTVSGYVVDAGAAYGSRNGLTHGWTGSVATVDRNRTSDQLRDTFAHMQAPDNRTARWEMAVPNGSYRVRVVVGDAQYFDGNFKLDVEGVRAVTGLASASQPFHEGTVTATVSDGRLTLANASGSYNTKLCLVEIVSTGTVGGPTPTPVPPPTSGAVTRINFQPSGAAPVSGWMIDAGSAYGARNGRTYGWNGSVGTIERNRTSDQLRDTSAYMQAPANRTARWEIAVPNGAYRVRVVVGDPQYFDGNFALDVEGVRAVSGLASSSQPFREGTVTATVSDGRLTLANAAGSYNTKLCFVEITAQ